MEYGFVRVACISPALTVADCAANAAGIISAMKSAGERHAQVVVFPELCITGYTCGDLFLQRTLQDAAVRALEQVARESAQTKVLAAVGLPLVVHGALHNCAAWVQDGKIIAVIPKTFIPNYAEFYERRYFTPAPARSVELIRISADYDDVPFGTDLLIKDKNNPFLTIGTEICEDLWVPSPPSVRHALAGATLIANLSASNEVVGKAAYRRTLVGAQSAKTVTAYLYADAGHDESTTDMVFGAHDLIAVNGTIAAEAFPFATEPGALLLADVDMERIAQERLRTTTFASCAERAQPEAGESYVVEDVELPQSCFCGAGRKGSIGFSAAEGTGAPTGSEPVIGGIDPHPFVPSAAGERTERCRAVVEMQAEGLARRLRHIHATSAVIGLSGGLDSTLALLVTARAFDRSGIPRSGITAVTMPGFGTTGRTHTNACALAAAVGATLRETDIKAAVRQHFADIGHDEAVHDVTYENAQARERTQVLMDLANRMNGIVIGTGDLSELALGWCTYNGDQMSMYGVNASIPKTLVRYLVAWFADEAESGGRPEEAAVLRDILATPVSPELLPPEGGSISQKTEELVGPYELHDFFLYYVLRWGFGPQKIFFLARQAFEGKRPWDGAEDAPPYTAGTILAWLSTFYRRFFSQQFKRSCMPDGAKVGTVSLSPRGDWRMPSDASAAAWLSEVERMQEEARG